MHYLQKLNQIIFWFGIVSLWCLCLMILGIGLAFNFSYTSAVLDDLSLYFFAFLVMVSLAYALKHQRHVCLDLLWGYYLPSQKRFIALLIQIGFVFPFSAVMLVYGVEFAWHSFLIGESSINGGVAYFFVFKSFIPLGFLLLCIQSLYEFFSLLKRP